MNKTTEQMNGFIINQPEHTASKTMLDAIQGGPVTRILVIALVKL